MKALPKALVPFFKPLVDWAEQVSRGLASSIEKQNNPLAIAPIPPSVLPIQESDVVGLVTDLAGKAPVGAKYICQVADAALTNEQDLSALATGLMKNTTGTGVVSIAAASDIPVHDHTRHTDRTRRVTIPIGAWQNLVINVVGTDPNVVAYTLFPTAMLTRTHCIFRVPSDYVSTPKLNVWLAQAADSVDIDINVYTKKLIDGTTSITAAYDNKNATVVTPAAADVFFVDPVTIATTLAAGDYVRLTVERDAVFAMGGDDNTGSTRFLGADFEYSADM